jgi:hypothetical protein
MLLLMSMGILVPGRHWLNPINPRDWNRMAATWYDFGMTFHSLGPFDLACYVYP